MIQLENLSKVYPDKAALFPLNLTLGGGLTHVILGSSGSGKSTLFRIMMGLIPATTGTVSLNGTMMTAESQQLLARKIGYVVQDSGLFPHLTGEQNAALLMRTLGHSDEATRKRINDLADLVQLERGLFKKYPGELSGGQKQRLGIVRALMLDPELIFMDEPLGALDPLVRSELQSQLKKIFELLKKTVLIITHDLGEAVSLGQTLSLFDKGHMVQHGSFQDLSRRPSTAFVSQFIHAQRPPQELMENL